MDNFDKNEKTSLKERIISIIIGLLLICLGIYLYQTKLITKIYNKFFSPPSEEIIVQETSASIDGKTIEGISPGIFLTEIGDKISNNTVPTFIGKTMHYGENLLLDADFILEENPVSGEKEYFLHFRPGKVQLLEFQLDNKIIDDIYGIPQYPTVRCIAEKESLFGGRVPVKFDNKKDCILGNLYNLPPVIFFYKPKDELTEGEHNFQISLEDLNNNIPFTIDRKFSISKQQLPEYKNNYFFENLDANDNCYSGYYYSADYLRIPLPRNKNNNLLYQILMSQSEGEKGDYNKIAKIKFDDKIYDLFFPQSDLFYDQEIPEYGIEPFKALYLPKNNLYFNDKDRAEVWKYERQEPKSQYGYGHEYFELLPVDISGRKYIEKYIPFETINWSGCDG